MSHEDGDVSMTSLRDEHCDMSLDHETIDVVWQSTQSTALQSILEESKLRKTRATSPAANSNDTASFILPGSLLPKSLFRDTSTTRSISLLGDQKPSIPLPQHPTRPAVSRAGSMPSLFHEAQRASSSRSSQIPSPDTVTDVRKIRPSQRRSSTRDQTTQSSDSAEVTQQDLESLKYMINTVSRIWGQENSSTSIRSSGSTSNFSARLQSGSSSESSRPEPVKTIKLGQPLETTSSRIRQSTSEIKGLMLPPALPTTTNVEPQLSLPRISKLPITAKPLKLTESALCDVSMVTEEADEAETSFDLSEPPSPSPTVRANPTRFQEKHEVTEFTREKRLSQGSSRPLSTNLLSQLRSGQPRSLSQTPLSIVNAPPKALGMRRTVSGNNVFPSKSTKRDTETKPPLSRIYSQASMTQEQARMKPKGFKVPWANDSPTMAPGSLPASQTSNLSVSSPVSESGSDSASGVGGSTTIQNVHPENPDSSYSFDDIDVEELDRVLSQCGA
ncbi:SubName: Full=Uncharacterized protein {ECO:0000313/EMBL:CCA68372.1} [Serendipita indica DSM 11827]|uniref:Uncharacterized protein n=1 Tax=Serendipita indica (strain DSM 11827) TaxID=1109443 RepID=G4TAM1_SERID|nr:SubName: Full=Uncharacterized protein {ECO:0000313/EMBL:CCA68372.1} [Serendipita indica DSM 11827]CCA68372.1 hypothetical protein PIIN_02238 [Serendipita indica DSM 11827]